MKSSILYKNFILSVLITFQISLPIMALELDLSVDEEIKKKYNTTQLEQDVLPALPKIDSQLQQKAPVSNTSTVPHSTPTYTNTAPVISKVDKKNAVKIPKWTKFQTTSNQKISDWSAKGSSVSFTSYTPVYKKQITIPAGTVFKGIVVDSHRPQITGNGGLVEIRLTNMIYNGKNIPINAKITKANTKKIFFNNIKGPHQYWKGVGKQIDKGENFYQKTRKTSSKLANNPIGIIISPVPVVIGWGSYAVCTVLSPVTGLFSKGGNISIPAGSNFEIKLLDTAYIY